MNRGAEHRMTAFIVVNAGLTGCIVLRTHPGFLAANSGRGGVAGQDSCGIRRLCVSYGEAAPAHSLDGLSG